MKRYREFYGPNTLSCASISGRRIHDFIKGWGIISVSGKSILWDHWVPVKPAKRIKPFTGKLPDICFPLIRSMKDCSILTDLLSVQPMQ